MRVSYINGTSGRTCRRGIWFTHWRKFRGRFQPLRCREQTFIERPEVGAHVQKDGSRDRNRYIVPLYKTHNREKGKSLDIDGRVKLVPANVFPDPAVTVSSWHLMQVTTAEIDLG